MFEHGTGVGYFEKVDVLRLEFDECCFGKAYIGDRYDGSFFDEEILHHPEGDIAGAFLGGEFEDAAVGHGAFLGGLEFEEHGVVYL